MAKERREWLAWHDSLSEEERQAAKERVYAAIEEAEGRRVMARLERIRLHGRTPEDEAEFVEGLKSIVRRWKEEHGEP